MGHLRRFNDKFLVDETPLALTSKHEAILNAMWHSGLYQTYGQIADQVYGVGATEGKVHSLKVLMCGLRQRMTDAGVTSHRITTVYGKGLRLELLPVFT